jgi:predicted DNA-binding transcriptional regulator YafY
VQPAGNGPHVPDSPLLQNKEYPNSPLLAREHEVSKRTIKRDIEFMKYRMDLPIQFDTRLNGYYYTEEVEHFPQVPMSEAELFAMLVAHKAIAQYKGTPFEKPLDSAFTGSPANSTAQSNSTLAISMKCCPSGLSRRATQIWLPSRC